MRVGDGRATRRVLRGLAERHDMVGVALHRVAGPADPFRSERSRRAAEAMGRAAEVGAVEGLAVDPLTGHLVDRLVEASLTAAPFALVVTDSDDVVGDPTPFAAAVGRALDRRIVVVDDPAALQAPGPPPPAPLSAAELALLEVALGPAVGVARAWSRWRLDWTVDRWPGLGPVGARLADALERAETPDVDRDRLVGMGRRAKYVHRVLATRAGEVVAALTAAGTAPVLLGGLAHPPPEHGPPPWCTRVEVAVDPDAADRAVAVLVDAGWTPARRRTGLAPYRDHLALVDADGIGLRLAADPLPRRGSRRFVPDRTRSDHLGVSVTVLDAPGSLVRHWVGSAGRSDRVPAVCETADRIATLDAIGLDAALAGATRLGVAATAALHLDTVRGLVGP